MSMSIEDMESFLKFCESLKNVYIRSISDPNTYKHPSFYLTIDNFLKDSGYLFDLETYKAHANEPACKLLKELHEKIKAYQAVDDISYDAMYNENFLSDPRWIEIQTLAKKTSEAITVLLKEKRPHE